MTTTNKTWARFLFTGIAWGAGLSLAQPPPPISLAPTAMPLAGTVDIRYQSYNVEMAEVVGGNFWKRYDNRYDNNNGATQAPAAPASPAAPSLWNPEATLSRIGEGPL